VQLENMHTEVRDGVATVVLNRPAVLNCIHSPWLRDLHLTLDALAGRTDVLVVVIRGAGRSFCSGLDLTALSEERIEQEFFRSWELALRRIETMEAMVVAAIHSHCLGGGLQLALACDIRVARDDARLGLTAAHEGIIPGLGAWRVARFAGVGRAKQLALLADVIDAPTALAWGLVDVVAGPDAFNARVSAVVERLGSVARTSTALTKKLIDMAFDTPFSGMVDTFCEYQRRSTASVEHRQAMAARRAAAMLRR
jgi:enoyl-CoA hydratase/carnithine racemase